MAVGRKLGQSVSSEFKKRSKQPAKRAIWWQCSSLREREEGVLDDLSMFELMQPRNPRTIFSCLRALLIFGSRHAQFGVQVPPEGIDVPSWQLSVSSDHLTNHMHNISATYNLLSSSVFRGHASKACI